MLHIKWDLCEPQLFHINGITKMLNMKKQKQRKQVNISINEDK